MSNKQLDYREYVAKISQRGVSIYDSVDPDLWIPTSQLEVLLNDRLAGMSLHGLPIKTRSKVVKQAICRALGYPIPRSFKKTQPRFPEQLFDVYIQKSNNLQIWNEEVSPTRRYVLIRVSSDDVITRVRVVTGDTLALFDKTGTLTQKYQARLVTHQETTELVVSEDTDGLKPLLREHGHLMHFDNSPVDNPMAETLLPISVVFERLVSLVGHAFADVGYDQERNRGAELHRLVCQKLGYDNYQDAGSFPDIRHQLLEVKLQTSPTIDLGLVQPDSQEPLDIPRVKGRQIRPCDVRYALFHAHTDGTRVVLTHFYLTTGEAFFGRFPQFQGKVVNRKLQIPIPSDFFD
jgi:hypothetical protein